MNRKQALVLAQQRLEKAGLENAPREARLLLSYALQCEALELILHPEIALTEDEEATFHNWLNRRAAREPLARIHGMREFWGLPFGMNEATLEPRPDSETLIECVLKHFTDYEAELRILDIGTGTGCILLSLLHEYKNAHGVGTDKSARGLEAAQQNAIQLGLKNRVEFIETNWCENIAGAFDVVVSNPPYIAQHELELLQPEVKLYDPMLALDGGEDGLAPYRIITPRAKNLLKNAGLLAFEVGHTQSEAVCEILNREGFKGVATRKDLQNIPRVVFGVNASGTQ